MNIEQPDKKSIMMYVMCYFQALPHSNIVIDDADTPVETKSAESAFIKDEAYIDKVDVKVTPPTEQTQVGQRSKVIVFISCCIKDLYSLIA